MIKVFTKDSNGKISFTENELKKLLDEAYWEGYNNHTNSTYTYCSPYSPYSWTTTASTVTLNSNSATAATNTIPCADGIVDGTVTTLDTCIGGETVTGK